MERLLHEVQLMISDLLSAKDCRALRQVCWSWYHIATEKAFRELPIVLSDSGLRHTRRLLQSDLSTHVKTLLFVFPVSDTWRYDWEDETSSCENLQDVPWCPTNIRRRRKIYNLIDLARNRCHRFCIHIETRGYGTLDDYNIANDCSQYVYKRIIKAVTRRKLPLSLLYSTPGCVFEALNEFEDNNTKTIYTIDTLRVALVGIGSIFSGNRRGVQRQIQVRRLIIDTLPTGTPPRLVKKVLSYLKEPQEVIVNGAPEWEVWKEFQDDYPVVRLLHWSQGARERIVDCDDFSVVQYNVHGAQEILALYLVEGRHHERNGSPVRGKPKHKYEYADDDCVPAIAWLASRSHDALAGLAVFGSFFRCFDPTFSIYKTARQEGSIESEEESSNGSDEESSSESDGECSSESGDGSSSEPAEDASGGSIEQSGEKPSTPWPSGAMMRVEIRGGNTQWVSLWTAEEIWGTKGVLTRLGHALRDFAQQWKTLTGEDLDRLLAQ